MQIEKEHLGKKRRNSQAGKLGEQFGEGKNIREERQIITGREEEEEEHQREG